MTDNSQLTRKPTMSGPSFVPVELGIDICVLPIWGSGRRAGRRPGVGQSLIGEVT